MFMDDTSDAQIAPSGDFFNTTTINCDNPLLSAQQLNIDLRARPTRFVDPSTAVTRGDRLYRSAQRRGRRARGPTSSTRSWRMVGGMRGDLLKGVSYDAYYQYGTTRFSQAFLNDFSVTPPATWRSTSSPTRRSAACRALRPGLRSAVRLSDSGRCDRPQLRPVEHLPAGGVTPAGADFLQTPLLSARRTSTRRSPTPTSRSMAASTASRRRGRTAASASTSAASIARNRSTSSRTSQFQSGDGAGQGGADRCRSRATSTCARRSPSCRSRSSATASSRN